MGVQIHTIKKILRVFALAVFSSIAFIIVVLTIICIVARFDFAENYLRDVAKEYINDALSSHQINIEIDRLELALPFSFHVHGLNLNDDEGTFVEIEIVSFSSRFFSLLRYEVVVPDIGLVGAQIMRIPNIVFPEQVEAKPGQFAVPNMKQVLIRLTDVLFHPNMPTIRFNNIHANDVLVDSRVITQIKALQNNSQEKLNFPQENTMNPLETLRISFVADASLDETLFRIASSLEMALGTDSPMTFNASLDIFKSKKIRSRIQYDDADGIAFRLAQEIFSLAPSQKAYASFQMEGSGSFDEFSMKYDANIFDDMYMRAPSTLAGELGIVPWFATTNVYFPPKILDTINHGDVRFSASAHILSVENQVNISSNFDESADFNDSALQMRLANESAQVKNIQVKYDFSAMAMDFVNPVLKGILGKEQKSQGQLDIVFSKNQHPYAISENISFESKNIKANTSIFISQEIDIHAQASILDLSALGSKTKSVSGRAEGKISITGDVNKLFLDARFEVPILKVQIIKEASEDVNSSNGLDSKEDNAKNDNKNSENNKSQSQELANKDMTQDKNIELESFVFVLKSQGQDINAQARKENIKKIKLAGENRTLGKTKNTQALISAHSSKNNEKSSSQSAQSEESVIAEKNAYAVQVKDFFQLFLRNERKPLPFSLELQAKYNNMPVHFSSQLFISAEMLGKKATQSRDIEINNIAFQGLGAKVQGKMHVSWDASDNYFADFAYMPLLRGNIKGTLNNGESLALALGQAIDVENASFKGDFSVSKPKKVTNVKSTVLTTAIPILAKKYSGSQEMRLQFSAKRLGYDTFILQNNSANILANDMWVNPYIKASARIKNLEFDANKSQNWRLDIDGSLLNLKVKTSLDGDATFLFSGVIGIDRTRKDLFLDMHILNFTYPKTKTDISLKQKGQFRFSDKEFLANKIHFVIAPKGEIQLNGVLRREHVELNGWWKDIDLKYLPFGYGGYLLGRFSFQGTSKNPTGSVDIRIQDFKAQGYPPVSLDINGSILAGKPIHKLVLAISLAEKERAGAKTAEIKIQIPMKNEPRLRIAKDLPLTGTVKYDGELATLWQYVPLDGRKLIGHLFIDGTVSGTLQNFFVELEAKVEKARYEDIILGVLLTNINIQLSLSPYGQGKILFSAFDNQSGTMSVQGDMVLPWLSHGKYKAPIKIIGKVPTQDERVLIKIWENAIAVVDLSSKIQNFKPLQRNDVQLALTGDLEIKGILNDPNITGAIRVDEGEIRLENIQVASIPKLNIVENAEIKLKKRRENKGSLDLAISIADKFYVFGQGIETEWKGKINLTGKVNKPILSGDIVATGGRMDLLGKNFTLAKGEVYFDGSSPISPIVNVQLGYHAQGLDATVGVSGTLQSPKLELASVPYLPEDEILARILFFSSVSELSAFEKIKLAAMITRLAGFNLNTGIKNSRRGFFGLDVIRIDSDEANTATNTSADANSDDEDTISVELGKYVRKNIYLGVEQGLNNQETVGITSIEIDNNLSVGAKAGTEDAEINFEWRFDY